MDINNLRMSYLDELRLFIFIVFVNNGISKEKDNIVVLTIIIFENIIKRI